MANVVATHYQQLMAVPQVYRPYPYVDAPPLYWDNAPAQIPRIAYPEVLKIVVSRKNRRSCDIRGLAPYLLK